MNKLYKILMVSFLTCCAFTAQAEEKTSSSQMQTATLEKYTNSAKGYSLEYPSDWKKNDVPQLDLVLFAPSKGTDQTTHASMNIVSEKVGNGISLDQFYSESAANLTSALKEVQVQKSGTTDLNGTTSKWMLYTHVMQNVKFRVLQYFVVANETIYLITFSTAADDFESYRSEFETIANSFKIAKATTPATPAAAPAK